MAPCGNLIRSTISVFLFDLVLFQIISSSKYPRSGAIKSVHTPLLELYELTFFSFNQINDGLKIKSEMSTHLKISQIKLSMYIFFSTHDSTALLHSSLFMITSPSSSFTPQPCHRHGNLKCCTEDLVYICKIYLALLQVASVVLSDLFFLLIWGI